MKFIHIKYALGENIKALDIVISPGFKITGGEEAYLENVGSYIVTPMGTIYISNFHVFIF
jgi:hypothetical protein